MSDTLNNVVIQCCDCSTNFVWTVGEQLPVCGTPASEQTSPLPTMPPSECGPADAQPLAVFSLPEMKSHKGWLRLLALQCGQPVLVTPKTAAIIQSRYLALRSRQDAGVQPKASRMPCKSSCVTRAIRSDLRLPFFNSDLSQRTLNEIDHIPVK